MNGKIFIATASVIIIYLAIIIGWHVYVPQKELAVQAPGADNRPPETARKADDVRIGEFFMRYEDTSPSLTGKWICFRGESYSNIIRTDDELTFDQDTFPTLWGVETGEGHAAPVIYNGLVYFLDYDEGLSADMLRCFSLETGKEQWRRWYRVPMKRNHGFSRTVP
ncbi:MAG: hypothetical protein LBJ57_01255, partial [Prevotellaceae bacterium]|nr:hypothetical protein [Prevotellaceae bacterium]